MHSRQSTFSVIVSAATFELLDAAGVAALLTSATVTGYGAVASLTMSHNDTTMTDSALQWTRDPANLKTVKNATTVEFVELVGPTELPSTTTQRPGVRVETRTTPGNRYQRVLLDTGAVITGAAPATLELRNDEPFTTTSAQLSANDVVLQMTDSAADGTVEARLDVGGAFLLMTDDVAAEPRIDLNTGSTGTRIALAHNIGRMISERGPTDARVDVSSDVGISFVNTSATQHYEDSDEVPFIRKVDGTSAGRGYGHSFTETIWGTGASIFDLIVPDTGFIISGFPNNPARGLAILDVSWAFDCECIALGGGAAVATMVVNGVAVAPQAIFTPTAVGQRQTTSQRFIMNVPNGALTILLNIRKVAAGGTLRVYGLHTHMSAMLHA